MRLRNRKKKNKKYVERIGTDLVLVWLMPALPRDRSSSFISFSPGTCIGVLVARLNPIIVFKEEKTVISNAFRM